MFQVDVDRDKCTGDEKCVNACPAQVFEMVDGKSEPVNMDEFLGCETCVEVCPGRGHHRYRTLIFRAAGQPSTLSLRWGGGRVMRQVGKYLCSLFIAAILLVAGTTASKAEDFTKPDELVLKSEAVFKSFMADPNMDWFREHVADAKGVFIIPQLLRGGFFIGGSGGNGALLALDGKTGQWSYPAFYTMGSVSFGMQIGVAASEIVLMVMTDKGMEAMLSTEFKLGGDVSLAAGPLGASAKAQTADILAYGRSAGAFVGIAIDGAVIAPRYEWNKSFYGKDVLLTDILINQTVRNSKADNLRAALPMAKPMM